MESIKELRVICQESFKEIDPLQAKWVCRRFSIYITWILLHTRINAMQTTGLFLFIGFIPGVLFAYSHYLTGAIFLQIWYIFDGVDGEIARYRKETSLTGVYFDYIIHYIIHPYIFVCIGYGLYKDTGSISLFLYAVSAALSVVIISALRDITNATLFDAGLSKKITNAETLAEDKGSIAALKSIFSLLHKLCTYPTIMNVITIVAFADVIFRRGIFQYLIIFYGITAPVIWISKLYVAINKRELDQYSA